MINDAKLESGTDLRPPVYQSFVAPNLTPRRLETFEKNSGQVSWLVPSPIKIPSRGVSPQWLDPFAGTYSCGDSSEFSSDSLFNLKTRYLLFFHIFTWNSYYFKRNARKKARGF